MMRLFPHTFAATVLLAACALLLATGLAGLAAARRRRSLH